MGKAAAKPKTTTSAQGELEQLIDTSAQSVARYRLAGQLVSMGWQLLIVVLIPILLGVWLDRRFGSTPSCSLTGFMLAIVLASYLIYREYRTIQNDTEETQENDNHQKGRA